MCLIHVGTHKTGTTAVQRLLLGAADELRAQGIVYPRSGIFGAGHHNLVFELTGDERFARSNGTWADLAAEMRAGSAERMCLSSEAFGYFHERPKDLAYVRDAICAMGFTPVVLLYVRPQAQLAASLFGELAKHRHTGSFEDFLREVCRTGAFRSTVHGAPAVYSFAYDAIASGFARVLGRASVMVRPYSRKPGAVVDDVLELLGGEPVRARLAGAAKRRRLNASEDLAAVVRRYADNVARSTPSEDARALARTLREGPIPDVAFEPLSPQHLLRLVTRFAPSNVELARTWHVKIPVVPPRQIAEAIVGALDPRERAVASRRTLRSLRSLCDADSTRRRAPRTGAQ